MRSRPRPTFVRKVSRPTTRLSLEWLRGSRQSVSRRSDGGVGCARRIPGTGRVQHDDGAILDRWRGLAEWRRAEFRPEPDDDAFQFHDDQSRRLVPR